MMNSFLIDKIKLALTENGISSGKLSYAAIHSNPQNRGRITLLIYEDSQSVPIYVAKIPRTNLGRQALEREQNCLQRCTKTNKFLRHQIQRIYWNDEDINFILEKYFQGQRIADFQSAEKASPKVLDWIIQLQQNSSAPIRNTKDFLMFGLLSFIQTSMGTLASTVISTC